jgi:TetR/AcrR family transcriptional regulator
MAISARRQRERKARRQAILDAAERVMCMRGLSSTTMEDVAAEAELSKGTLYLYFENRDALCAALAERTIQELLPSIEEAVGGAGSGLEGVERAMHVYARFFASHPHLVRMAASWMLAGVQCAPDAPDFIEYRNRLASVMALVVQSVLRGQEDNTVRKDVDARLLAVQVWGGLIGSFLMQLNREDLFRRLPFPIDADAIIPLYIDNILRGIRPDAHLEVQR